ncbi:Pentatricopeptide repeat-containing protein [Abeliophyllum distichum]|uniref:Pentatricopeptide repeat-containing protein n=1 Tax=Abeliophyllum distichum TaxID=126358 RepID=A0ABD1NTQ1_9LAMI
MGFRGEFNEEGVYSGTTNGNPRGTAVIKKEWVQELPLKETSRNEKIRSYPMPESTLCTFCMSENSCRMVRSRTKLMNILLERGKPQEAQSIFNKLIEGGHKPSLCKREEWSPDSVFFNAVVNAFSESGNMEEAMKTLLQMKEHGMKPTTSTFNTLIKGYGIAGKPEESLKVMELMSKEENVKPNLRTYNVLVRAWCNKKNINEAWNMVYKMVASGIQPDAITYNTIATAYTQNGQMEKAEEIILEMQNNNVQPNERTLSIIISGYCKEGFLDISDRDGVDEVLTLMEEFGVKPDVITFSTIMNAWSAAGYMVKCREIFNDMVEAGIKPDVHAYSILAKGYVRALEPGKAEELLTAMIESGIRPNVVIFTTIISGWCSAGALNSAMRVFEKMCEYGISPNLKTFETLIWGYAEAKKPWKAEETIQLMKQFNVRPEKSTFLLVAEAWRTTGLTKEANRMMITFRKQNTVRPQEMQHEMPVESLEKIYQKEAENVSYSRLQIPNVIVSDQKGSPAPMKRSRMVLREAEFTSESLCVAPKTMNLTNRLRERAPIVCQRQFQGQLFMSSQIAPLCTVLFLN